MSPNPAASPLRGSPGTACSALGGVLAQLPMPHGALAQLFTQQGGTNVGPSAPGRALAQFLQPWETPLQGCRAFQHLAKPLWLPAVCEGFSPLSWRRAVAPRKPFLRKLEQGWQLRSAVRESLCLPSRPPAQQSCPQQPPLLTQPLGQDAWGGGHTASTNQHKVLLITAPVHPVPSQGSPGSSSTFQWLVPCTRVARFPHRGTAGAGLVCGTAHARAGPLPAHRAGTGVQPCTVAQSGAQGCVQRMVG